MNEYSKNSLLGQLEEKGVLGNEITSPDMLPFGTLTGNFDMSSFSFNQAGPQENKPEPPKGESKIIKERLNDLDFNIFREGSYLDITDSELTTDEKIKKIKSMVKKIDEKLYMLEDFDDEMLIEKLKNEKETLAETLKILTSDTKSFINISTSNSPKVKDIADKINLEDKIREAEKIIFKFFPVLHKSFLVRKALNKLVMLNENAKELMLKKIPYGESEGRYNDFIAYLSCANVIHAKLTKKM